MADLDQDGAFGSDVNLPSGLSTKAAVAGTSPIEPLTVEHERTILSSLARVLTESAQAVRKLASDYERDRRKAESHHADRVQHLHERYASDMSTARTRHADALRQIEDQFTAEYSRTERELADIEERAEKDYATGSALAARQHKEARWEAEMMYDATKHGPSKRFLALRKSVEAIAESFDSLETESKALLTRWRQLRESEADTNTPHSTGDSVAQLQEQLAAAAHDYEALTQLQLPPIFEGARFGWIVVGVATLLAIPAWWLAAWHALWIVPLVTALICGLLGLWLFRKAQAQVEAIYPRLVATITGARQMADDLVKKADQQRQQEEAQIAARLERELFKADERFKERAAELTERRATELDQARFHYPARLEELAVYRDRALEMAEAQHAASTRDIEPSLERAVTTAELEHGSNMESLERATRAARQESSEKLHREISALLSSLHEIHERETELFPEWNALASATAALPESPPPGLRIGQFEISVAQFSESAADYPDFRSLMPERFTLPALLPFPDHASLLIKSRGAGRARAADALQAVMLRILSSLPPGKARFTIIDPVGLGESFSAFMHLADYDEALVTSRIWTEPRHIEQRLADLSEHMENVIQKYLRNEFETIQDYNAFAGEIAEPFRFLVVANFPTNFSDEATRRLLSILSSGARCGVSTLISIDLDARLPSGIQLRDLEQNSTVLLMKKSGIVWKDKLFRGHQFTLESTPPAEDVTRLLHRIGSAAKSASQVKVPFDFIVPGADHIWTADSRRAIDVPLGRAGATRLQHLRLGHGTSQHVLVAGQTGSGKSSLLHALVTNLALRYSPDEIELYLVDFKKGVEFKTYAAHELPHARVVAIESDREFGLSVLERLDAELKLRADRFRELGVSDIAGYRDAQPGLPLPRVLLVVDEFQELFVEDDKISQNASLLLDRLVRQGRAFGMHVLLGSQTLGGAYSLPRSTMGQIGVRIALRCSEVDAHLILSEENSAARLLSRAGEAIYNDSNGAVEGNHPFQIAWLDESVREQYLQRVQQLARERNGRDHRQVVFEGNVPARLDKNETLAAQFQAGRTTIDAPLRAWLGESVSIKEPTSALFQPQSGNNLLIVGQNDEAALGITGAAALSLLSALRLPTGGIGAAPARIAILDGSPAGSEAASSLAQLGAMSDGLIRLIGWRDLSSLLNELTAEVKRRGNPEYPDHSPRFLFIYGLQRFRDLRRQEDDFGFGRSDQPPTPSKQLATILREGPPLGIHTVVWCDSLNNLNRAFDRQSVREFEMRVVFQMSGGDSSTLIDTPAAGKLGPHRALYHSEEQGSLEKFRPYGWPSAEWLADFTGRLA